MPASITYTLRKPNKALGDFVESFWMLHNASDQGKEVVILPDGRIDLFLSRSATEPFHITLLGIGTHPGQVTIPAGTLTFAISFKLLATEYLLQHPVADLLNGAQALPDDFWNFEAADLETFEQFCDKASHKLQALLPGDIDRRKQKLFDQIYASNGAMGVNELAEHAGWSSRQINRYFTQHYGLSLKAYCSILRFRASFLHIKEGKLFPEENFADQSHFIKEIKRLSGVLPKDLNKNQNDRFIQFSTLDPE